MPSRSKTAPEAIASILESVDRLYLFLDRFESVPVYARDRKIEILSSQDFGEIGANGKLLGLKFAEPDDYFVCADDDNYYKPGFARRLVQAQRAIPGKHVFGVHGTRLPEAELQSYNRQRTVFTLQQSRRLPREVDIIATNGCVFKVSDLNLNVLKWQHINCVDLSFALEARRREIRLWVVPTYLCSAVPLDQMQPDSIYLALRGDDTLHTRLGRELQALGRPKALVFEKVAAKFPRFADVFLAR